MSFGSNDFVLLVPVDSEGTFLKNGAFFSKTKKIRQCVEEQAA